MTEETMTTDWDKEAIYDNEISPLVSQIIAICKREDLPLLLSVQYADTEDDGPAFCTTAIFPEHTSESLRSGFRGLKAGPPVMAMTITSARKP